MNYTGIIIGAAVFLIIGICHPIVIKLEYHLGRNSWWIMFAAGLVLAAVSLFVNQSMLSTIFGAASFSCFWGIGEIISQEKRVAKGWFPENPRRHAYYEGLRKKLFTSSGKDNA